MTNIKIIIFALAISLVCASQSQAMDCNSLLYAVGARVKYKPTGYNWQFDFTKNNLGHLTPVILKNQELFEALQIEVQIVSGHGQIRFNRIGKNQYQHVQLNPIDFAHSFVVGNDLYLVFGRAPSLFEIIKINSRQMMGVDIQKLPYDVLKKLYLQDERYPLLHLARIVKINRAKDFFQVTWGWTVPDQSLHSGGYQKEFESNYNSEDIAFLLSHSGVNGWPELLGYTRVITNPISTIDPLWQIKHQIFMPKVFRPKDVYDRVLFGILNAVVPDLSMFDENELHYTLLWSREMADLQMRKAVQEISLGRVKLITYKRRDYGFPPYLVAHSKWYRIVHPEVSEETPMAVNLDNLYFHMHTN
jgi:hypothetical protein